MVNKRDKLKQLFSSDADTSPKPSKEVAEPSKDTTRPPRVRSNLGRNHGVKAGTHKPLKVLLKAEVHIKLKSYLRAREAAGDATTGSEIIEQLLEDFLAKE